MVVAPSLVNVVGQAGIKDSVNLLLNQLFHVTMHNFCGVAGGIRRDTVLTERVNLAGGEAR